MLDAEDFQDLIRLVIPDGELSIQEVATRIINLLLALAGVIAFLYLIYTGILYITAGGSPDQAKKAQAGLINIIIGIIIIVLSYFIIRFTVDFITSLVS